MSTLTEKAIDLLAYLDKNARTPPQSDKPTVAELLQQSRNAHLVYRRALRHRANGVIVEGDQAAAADALATSARLRAKAEISDPKHTDAAWQDDMKAAFPHTALVEFYGEEVKVLLPPVAEEQPPPPPKHVEDIPPIADVDLNAETR